MRHDRKLSILLKGRRGRGRNEVLNLKNGSKILYLGDGRSRPELDQLGISMGEDGIVNREFHSTAGEGGGRRERERKKDSATEILYKIQLKFRHSVVFLKVYIS